MPSCPNVEPPLASQLLFMSPQQTLCSVHKLCVLPSSSVCDQALSYNTVLSAVGCHNCGATEDTKLARGQKRTKAGFRKYLGLQVKSWPARLLNTSLGVLNIASESIYGLRRTRYKVLLFTVRLVFLSAAS